MCKLLLCGVFLFANMAFASSPEVIDFYAEVSSVYGSVGVDYAISNVDPLVLKSWINESSDEIEEEIIIRKNYLDSYNDDILRALVIYEVIFEKHGRFDLKGRGSTYIRSEKYLDFLKRLKEKIDSPNDSVTVEF